MALPRLQYPRGYTVTVTGARVVSDPGARTWPRMLAQWARTACHERLGEAPALAPQYRHTGILGMLRGMDAIRRFRTPPASLGDLEAAAGEAEAARRVARLIPLGVVKG